MDQGPNWLKLIMAVSSGGSTRGTQRVLGVRVGVRIRVGIRINIRNRVRVRPVPPSLLTPSKKRVIINSSQNLTRFGKCTNPK